MKMKVEFVYPDHNPPAGRSAGVANKVPSSVAEGVENVRNRLARSTGDNDAASLGNSPELILTELQNLRKKYDAVVEYTVHLTAERDSIVGQLEVAQKELNREKLRKKSEGQTATKDKNEKKGVQVRFLFAFVGYPTLTLLF